MKFVYKILQFQFSVCPGSTAIFGHKSVTQPFSILKTEKENTKTPPKNDFFTKKSCHIIANYDSPCMKMGGSLYSIPQKWAV